MDSCFDYYKIIDERTRILSFDKWKGKLENEISTHGHTSR